MKAVAVVALGGHAILPKDEQPSVGRQFHHARQAMRHVLALLADRKGLVITHGNGPQVGHILIRSEAAAGESYSIPLSVAVAESEGEIGYVIQQSLYNELAEAGISRSVVTILTQVLVDEADQAFSHPTKPIGPYYNIADAEPIKRRGISLAHFSDRGWRRVVPSPQPLEIIESSTVRRLAEQDVIVIAAGGGGIPVIEDKGKLRGVDAVIDKDLASAVLATSIGAEMLVFLTDVPKVALNFQTPEQSDLDSITVGEAERYLREGHFAEGSMGPKVEGAIRFVKAGGRAAIITAPEELERALVGRGGTRISLAPGGPSWV